MDDPASVKGFSMKIARRFTQQGQDVYSSVEWDRRTSRISNPDGSVVFEMTDAEIPRQWSQLATDIMVSKYFRKAGVPQADPETGAQLRDESGNVVTGPEKSVKQVVNRLAGCWRFWGEKHGYFDTPEDAQAFADELAYMLLHQMCAPNSPQWFNTGLNWSYGITGPAQGHFYCDPKSGELMKSKDAYSHPQPHACFIQSISDDLVNPGGIEFLQASRRKRAALGRREIFGADELSPHRRPRRRRDQVGRHHPSRGENVLP
jgi:ribonucleoside-diphosphate reductase alpha chain